MSVGEYEHEPVRGLPEHLPEGETLIWRGEPDWRVMARRVFHVRTVAIYFAAIMAVHCASQLYHGVSLREVAVGSSWQLGLCLAALGILTALARAYASTTVYTLTNQRLVMRFGVALPMMVNIPLDMVIAADLRSFGNGSGDIIMTMDKRSKLSYMMLWPNVRSWHFSRVQPTLRSLSDVRSVAAALATVVDSSASTAEREAGDQLGSPAMMAGMS
jgi:hypothetical protein